MLGLDVGSVGCRTLDSQRRCVAVAVAALRFAFALFCLGYLLPVLKILVSCLNLTVSYNIKGIIAALYQINIQLELGGTGTNKGERSTIVKTSPVSMLTADS